MAQAPKKKSTGGMADMMTLYMSTPLVVASRLNSMWLNALSPTAAGNRENDRMVSEKMAAAGESIMATGTAIATQSMAAALGKPVTANGIMANFDAVAGAAMKPYAKRVRANAKRLSRPKS